MKSESLSSPSSHPKRGMSRDGLLSLRDLQDALRNSIPDVDSFVSQLSSTLQALHLHPTSSPPPIQHTAGSIKAINRILPAVQVLLITSAIPTFLLSLDAPQRDLLTTFFVPRKTSEQATLLIRRDVALTSYRNLTSFLAISPRQSVTCPHQSRDFLLSTLDLLAEQYSIDELYWAVWSSSASSDADTDRSHGLRMLQWEETVKAALGLPAKVANAIGMWMGEDWNSDYLINLSPK